MSMSGGEVGVEDVEGWLEVEVVYAVCVVEEGVFHDLDGLRFCEFASLYEVRQDLKGICQY